MEGFQKLDVGCGAADYPNARARGDVHIDIGTPEKIPENFVYADAHYLPFQDGAFSKVYYYDVIEHVDSPIDTLREINRVLERDGTVEISTPNPLHYRRVYRASRDRDIMLSYYPDHIYTWTDAELRHILTRTGFTVEKYEYSILLPQYHAARHNLIDWVLFRAFRKMRRIFGRNMIVNARKKT